MERTLELDALAGLDDGVAGAEQDLISAGAGLKGDVAGGAVAMVIVGFDVAESRDCWLGVRWMTATPPVSVVICWLRAVRDVDGEGGVCGGAVGIGGEEEDLIFEVRDERAALGDGGDEQRGLADGDGFAAGLGVGGGVFDGGFDEGARSALAQRPSGEVVGQLEIEVISAVGVGLAGGGGGFEDGDVHAGGFDGDVGVVDGFAEEVVGADGAGDVVAGAVVAFVACHPFR